MFFSVSRALRKARRFAVKGEFVLAEKVYREILQKYPNNARAEEELAALRRQRENIAVGNAGPPPGKVSTERVEAGQVDAMARINALAALCDQGLFQEVLVKGAELAKQFPDIPFIPNLLGAANLSVGRPQRAEACFMRALQINPDFAQAHNNLGNALNLLGRPEEAAASFERALRIQPDFVEALSNLAIVLNVLGRRQEAAECCEKALRIKPDMAEAHWNLSVVKEYREGDPQIDQLLRLAERPDLPDSDRMYLGFALGKVYENLGDRDKAFAYLMNANGLRKAELNYDISRDRALLARIKSVFSEDIPGLNDGGRPDGENSKKPVFIVGMPRSGTSLVEQILASHSGVYGAGELMLLERSVNTVDWHSERISADQLRSIRNAYLSGLERIGVPESCITDKMPRNFQWIGFIVSAVPEAKIVHVIRDARATCWSNFKTCFSENGIGFVYDLSDVAEYYKMYADLMAFWHRKYPGRIYDLNYESLTEHQEEESRKLLEYVDLAWEDQCLDFHKNERVVRTASSAQVRQKMYQGSSEQWRKFERHLEPMTELLGDI